jgi:hypothetical protein
MQRLPHPGSARVRGGATTQQPCHIAVFGGFLMSSFSTVLLDQGVEVEMQAGLPEIISVLDRETPDFGCQGYGYRLVAGKGKLGTRWLLLIKLVSLDTHRLIESPVGHVELEKLDTGVTRFKIPPRGEMDYPGMSQFDSNGTFLSSFIYQTLNALQRNQLINLPGVLPVI